MVKILSMIEKKKVTIIQGSSKKTFDNNINLKTRHL